MTTTRVEIVQQAAPEQVSGAHPRILSDNGPQFIAQDFKASIRLCEMTHVRTRPIIRKAMASLSAGINP